MTYRSPVAEFKFILKRIVDFDAVTATDLFAEATPDVTDAIVLEAARLCDTVLAPLQRAGDLHPAHLTGGIVSTPPGFAQAYHQIAEGGWIGMAATPENGGMGLPLTLTSVVNEMMSGACLALQISPLMSQGQIEALEHHASDEIRARFLPPLISGAWNGTMNLTEPGAGSDVGALKSRAVPNGDGTYAITGQKIYISWGDNDFTPNVCHLVLARLPDGAPGTKGISLFMVPKFLPDNAGVPGSANSLSVVSLEHKMGLHGSPTAVMQYDRATGWLVGEEHGGMSAMFTMMNNARLGVGLQGVGQAEAACQKATAYALERKQGRTGTPAGVIADHADVRRMLMEMRADVFAARALTMDCAVALDMARAAPAQDAPAWQARAAFLTPIAKAFGTDTGIRVAGTGVQVHGGMGYIEETGAAQYYRDVRVTAIYEGTNGIQAMDLVGRKLADDGEAACRILEEISQGAETAKSTMPVLAKSVWSAAECVREATDWMLDQDAMNTRFAGAVPYLGAFARVLGAHYHLRAALAVSGTGPRAALARFYIRRMLPEHSALLAQMREGQDGLFALSHADLAG